MFDPVFNPLKVGSLTLPNRIVFPPFQTNYATADGFVTDRVLRFYREIARGGTGLTMVGCVAVSADGAGATNVLRLTTEEHEAGCAELFEAIKANGSVAGVQLIHFGRQTLSAITRQPLVAASAIPCPVMQERPRELSGAEIQRIETDFARAARRAKRAGADLIELHAAFGYLLGGFLSTYSNKRTDEYGGSLENRTRMVREVIAAVRNEVGDLPMCCRISGAEFVHDGLTLEETKQIASLLVDAGIDMISVVGGVYESMNQMLLIGMEPGAHVYLAAGIKEVVDVPVVCAGNISSLALAEQILTAEHADLVAMGRAQVADPQLVNKSRNGQLDRIVECDRDCQHCAYWLSGESAMSCPKNLRL